jgi:hypothetical protein
VDFQQQRGAIGHGRFVMLSEGLVGRLDQHVISDLLVRVPRQCSLVGFAQALKALRVIVRAGLFQQGGILALDRTAIGIRRQAEDIPASHVRYSSLDNRRRHACFTA